MRYGTSMRRVIGGVLLLCLCGPALAQSDGSHRNFSAMLNVDALLDNYLRVLARKYDLSEEQTAYTEQFVRQRLDQFLDRHSELGGLVDRLFDVRSGGEMSQDELIAWGKQVLPIYNEAKGLIVQANSEWREILTDQQKLIHDEDIHLMMQSFGTTDDQLQRMVTGQMTVDEFRNPRSPRTTRVQPPPATPAVTPVAPAPVTPTPSAAVPTGGAKPETAKATRGTPAPTPTPTAATPTRTRTTPQTGASVSTSPVAPGGRGSMSGRHVRSPMASPVATGKDFESQWEAYVREFIARYQLNEDQQARANKILKGCQSQAERYVRSHQNDIDRLDKRIAELAKGPKDKDQVKEAADLSVARAKLLEPVNTIFEKQLKPRLDKLPTRAQREAAEKAPPKPAGGPAPTGQAAELHRAPPVPPPQPQPVPQPQPQPQPEPIDPPNPTDDGGG